jgi:hypothetical protein
VRFERRADALILVWLVAIRPLMATLLSIASSCRPFHILGGHGAGDRGPSGERTRVVLLLGALCEAT